MKIISNNMAKPTTIIWKGKEVSTDIFKEPIDKPVYLGSEKVRDDEVSDRENHGGIYQACYIYSSDHYAYWKNKYPNLHWTWGMFGENLTVTGLDERDVCVGDVYRVGETLV